MGPANALSGNPGPVIILAVFAALLLLETLFPLRRRKLPRTGRFALNFILTGFVFIIGNTVVKAAGLGLAAWGESANFGLLRLVDMPFNLRFAFGFLLMDLSFYYWHRINHEWPLLWRFHNVHHVDPDLDVTTSFRFHFAEVLYSTGFRALQVVITGVSPATYAAYEIVFACETAFHHSNLRLPVTAERAMNKVIVTPRMHGIHHSQVKEEANSNYSTIFRWWDSLHGTLRLGVRQPDVDIGVPAYSRRGDNTFKSLISLPFVGQRDYWRREDGVRPERLTPHTKLMLE